MDIRKCWKHYLIYGLDNVRLNRYYRHLQITEACRRGESSHFSPWLQRTALKVLSLNCNKANLDQISQIPDMDYLSNYRMPTFGVKLDTHLSLRNAFQMKFIPSGTGMAQMTSQATSQAHSLLCFLFAKENNTRKNNNLQIILKSLPPNTWFIKTEMISQVSKQTTQKLFCQPLTI